LARELERARARRLAQGGLGLSLGAQARGQRGQLRGALLRRRERELQLVVGGLRKRAEREQGVSRREGGGATEPRAGGGKR